MTIPSFWSEASTAACVNRMRPGKCRVEEQFFL